MSEQVIPRLRVAAILDKTTLVISGTGIDQLHKDEDLWVVGTGPVVANTDLPLVVPKGTVAVTMIAPAYVIAKPEIVEEEVPVHSVFAGIMPPQPGYKTVKRRPALNVDEQSLAGNPGSTPIRVGDAVIRPKDVGAFVALLAQEKQP